MILNNLWKKKIAYDFLKGGVYLTDIPYEEWADIPEQFWLLKTKYTQRWITRLLRIRAPKEKIEKVQKKKYCCIIEIDGCITMPLEIPEKFFIQVVSKKTKGLFFTKVEDILLIPNSEDYIEMMWTHILDTVKECYEEIKEAKEKSLAIMRRNIIKIRKKK